MFASVDRGRNLTYGGDANANLSNSLIIDSRPYHPKPICSPVNNVLSTTKRHDSIHWRLIAPPTISYRGQLPKRPFPFGIVSGLNALGTQGVLFQQLSTTTFFAREPAVWISQLRTL